MTKHWWEIASETWKNGETNGMEWKNWQSKDVSLWLDIQMQGNYYQNPSNKFYRYRENYYNIYIEMKRKKDRKTNFEKE